MLPGGPGQVCAILGDGPPADRFAVAQQPHPLERIGADVEEAQSIGTTRLEPLGLGPGPTVDGRHPIPLRPPLGQHEHPVGVKIPLLAGLQHQERPVQPLRQFVPGLAVDVVHERAGAAGRDQDAHGVARRDGRPRHAGVAAPAAHAVIEAPELEAVPVDGEWKIEAVVDDDLRGLPARQDQRAAGDPCRVGGRRHGILRDDERQLRVAVEYVGPLAGPEVDAPGRVVLGRLGVRSRAHRDPLHQTGHGVHVVTVHVGRRVGGVALPLHGEPLDLAHVADQVAVEQPVAWLVRHPREPERREFLHHVRDGERARPGRVRGVRIPCLPRRPP